MAQQQPTWLVTGAAGFLGANLGKHLQGRAHRVGLARTAAVDNYDHIVTGDLADPRALEAVVTQVQELHPDVIVHAAAMATHEACEEHPDSAHQVNAVAAAAIGEAAARVGARFILISTDAVFDGSRGHYTEEDTPIPFSTYGRTKLAGERLTLEANPDSLVVRTNFFGWSPSGSRSILEFFVNNLRSGMPVKGFTDFTVTSAYVGVLCEVLEELAATDTTGLLHVTSPDALSKYEFGVAVAEEFGLDFGLITPTAADIIPPRNRDLSLDIAAAQEVLGRALPSQREGVARARSDEGI